MTAEAAAPMPSPPTIPVADEELRSLKRALTAMVETLALVLDHRSRFMHGHTQRVATYTQELARAMGVTGPELDMVCRGARLHDPLHPAGNLTIVAGRR